MKKKNLNLILGSILTGLVLLVVLVGIFYTPYDPTAMDNANKLSGVTLAHPFGCDNFGRPGDAGERHHLVGGCVHSGDRYLFRSPAGGFHRLFRRSAG